MRSHRTPQVGGPPLLHGTVKLKVDHHFFVHGTKKERMAAKKEGRPEVRWIGFNKSLATHVGSDSYYRYKVPLPADAMEGQEVEVELSKAKPFSRQDFLTELNDEIQHHKGNMSDPRALLLILLYFGPFFLISGQAFMFAGDLAIRGPAAVSQGDLFGLSREDVRLAASKDSGYFDGTLYRDALPRDVLGSVRGMAASFVGVRGANAQRDEWEAAISQACDSYLSLKEYECPTCCERAALTSLRSGSAGPANRTLNTEPVSGSCVQATIRNVQRKVTFLNASGGQVGSADSEINVKGTFCGEGIVFVFVLFMVPLLLLGGFAHMTWGWRRDLKNFVSTALKREMSEAAKAVAQQAATEDDRFGLRGVGSTEGSAKGMIGDSNAYKSSWMKRGHKLGDIDGDGTVDTIGQKQGCCARCCFKLKKFQYMMAGSPEEVMLYTEAMEISLALFSVYRFSALNIGDTFGVQFVILVAFLQCIIAPSLLLSNRPSLCIVAMSVFDMFVDFFYSLMALSRSLTVFNARDACIQEQWSTHPCNGLFVDWTFVDVLLTFYGCVIPPYLFSRKVVRQHTTIAWQNFKYYFDRTSGSVGLQDKQLNRLLHWTSRNIVLLPGPRRDSFLFRVKTFYSIGLMMSFAMWWYLELLPVQDYCEDSGAFFRAVPANFPTGSFLDIDEIATCKGYMEFGVSAYGNDYNATLCSANFTLIEHNYLTYRKICPRQCGQCGSDLTGLRQETAEAQESALFMTFLLSFIFLMIGLLAKATGLGQRCAYRLEAYEGKRDDLAAFNEAQGMSEAALKAELAKVELENSELAEQRLTDLHEQKLDKMLGQEHRNPMMDTDSSDDDDESPKTSHDTKGHYVDDDDDF